MIIKYFFDFLDGAAARHGITDPDVLHTWKCNRCHSFRCNGYNAVVVNPTSKVVSSIWSRGLQI